MIDSVKSSRKIQQNEDSIDSYYFHVTDQAIL